jgi:hypothetical protein
MMARPDTGYAECMKTAIVLAALIAAAWLPDRAMAEVYAYVNEAGDYVVTKDNPGRSVAEYAVLSDDGEYLRTVRPRELDVPITHWRPWFLPKEPDPFDADPELYREREGRVGVEEVEPVDED